MKRKVKADLSSLCVASLLLVTTPAINAHAVEPSTPTSTSSSESDQVAKPKIKYSNTVISDGSLRTITPSVGGSSDGLSFDTPEDFPDWATVSSDGSVELDAPEGTSLSDTYSIPVTYSDGSQGSVPLNLTVHPLDGDPKMNTQYSPFYKDSWVSVGGSGTVNVSFVKTAPEGTKFSLASNAPSWSSVDSSSGMITYTNVPAPESGGLTSVPVVITYSDESVSRATLRLNVGQPFDEVVDPVYAPVEVAAGASSSSRTPVDRGEGKHSLDPNNGGVVSHFKFGDGHPSWVFFTAAGSIVAAPPEDAEVKEYTIPVIVTYKDNTTDTVNVKVKVTPFVDESNDPLYPGVVKAVPGVSLKLPAPDNAAEGTKFEPCEGATPKWALVEVTGSVTVTLPKGTGAEGSEVCVADNEGHQHKFRVVPTEAKKGPSASAKIGQATEVAAPKGVAGGAKFSGTSDTPRWVTVNQDGSLVVAPKADVKPGEHTFHIGASSPEGAMHYSVKINVTESPSESVAITYPGMANVAPGVDATIPAPKGAPEGTKFSLAKGAPEWVSIDSKDGSIKISSDKSVPGDYVLTVVATLPDDTPKEIPVNFRVTAPFAHNFSYPYTFTVIEGETLVTGTPDGSYPEGTKFTFCGDSNPEWVSIDSSGSITANPNHTHGIFDVCVKAKYPDGTSSESTATFQVFPRELIHRGTDFIDPATLAPGAEMPYFPDHVGPTVPADQVHLPAPVTESSKKFLAVTGANVGFLLGTALALVALGGVGVFLARRRKG